MKRWLLLLCLLAAAHAQVYLSQQSSELAVATVNSGQACWSSTTAPCKIHFSWSYAVPSGYALLDYCIQRSNTQGGTRWPLVTPANGGTPVLEPFCWGHATGTFIDDAGIWPGQTYYYSVAAELAPAAVKPGTPNPPTGLSGIVK